MNHYNILVWTDKMQTDIMFRKLEKSAYSVTVKNGFDFGGTVEYSSQRDFDRIYEEYHPDIVVVFDQNRSSLSVQIPENVCILTYLDMFPVPFYILGKKYFQNFPVNNYMYLPALDMERYDSDHVLRNSKIKEKIIVAPFIPAFCNDTLSECPYPDRFMADIAITTAKREWGFYRWALGIDDNTAVGKAAMQVLYYMVPRIRNEIQQRESAFYDDSWLEHLLIVCFDKFNFWQYSADKEQLISLWVKICNMYIIPNEYKGIIVHWLIESGLNVKIWGQSWKSDIKARPNAMGCLKEGNDELKWATYYSRIALDNHCVIGIHRKLFEAMQSGSLYMMPSISDDLLYSDYRRYFKDGESIAVFRNKKELFLKINYYLSHEGERRAVTKRAQNIIREQHLDTQHVIEGVFGELISRIKNGYSEN